jgi:PAS domain S-box-containing protein
MQPISPRTSLRVLLVEDNTTDALVACDELAQAIDVAFTVEQATRLQTALALLAGASFDVVLLDLSLPDCDGLDTFLRLRAAAPELPVVVLSHRVDEALALQAVHAGAQDYLVKGGAEGLLVRAIRYAIERARAALALRSSELRLAGVVDSAMDAIISVDAGQCIVLFNAAAERMFGYAAEEVMGQRLERLLPLAFRARHHAQVANFGVTGASSRAMGALAPVSALRANGEEFPIEASISKVKVDGQLLLTVILRDVTEPRRAAQQVLDTRESLRALLRRLQQSQEDERRRVAREIHDELGQLLTGLKMDLRWLERKLSEPGLPLAMNALLDRTVAASALNDQTMATVQKLAVELRPAALDQLGLAAALAQRTRQFQQRTGVACTLHSDELLQTLPPAVTSEMYYICQEALTNVTRHAQATQVAVRLRAVDDGVQLEIEDDGVGIDPAVLAAPRSLGLLGMRERALSCDGSLAVAAVAPHGTCVTVWVPRLEAAR